MCRAWTEAWSPLAGAWVREVGSDTKTLPKHSLEHRPRLQAGPSPRRRPLLHPLGLFTGVSARPCSERGPEGCVTEIAHRHTGSCAVRSCSGADRPEDWVTESAVSDARAGATGLQQGRGGDRGRDRANTASPDAPSSSNLRPRLRRALL